MNMLQRGTLLFNLTCLCSDRRFRNRSKLHLQKSGLYVITGMELPLQHHFMLVTMPSAWPSPSYQFRPSHEVFYLEVGLETPRKRTETKEKGFQSFISSRNGPEKSAETRHEMKERKQTALIFLHSFISCLVFVLYQVHPYLNEVLQNIFLQQN